VHDDANSGTSDWPRGDICTLVNRRPPGYSFIAL
jgi:hypothetical protein